MVAVGRVRAVDKIGDDSADIAADFGRRRVSDLVMNIRGRFVSACAFWYPVVLDLHRFLFLLLVLLSMRMGVLELPCILPFGLRVS